MWLCHVSAVEPRLFSGSLRFELDTSTVSGGDSHKQPNYVNDIHHISPQQLQQQQKEQEEEQDLDQEEQQQQQEYIENGLEYAQYDQLNERVVWYSGYLAACVGVGSVTVIVIAVVVVRIIRGPRRGYRRIERSPILFAI